MNKKKDTNSLPESTSTRLNKYISNSGVCSRRDADIYISSGNVSVNGKIITEMGFKVNDGDVVNFDGRKINPSKKAYVLLNKPKGFATNTRNGKQASQLIASASKSELKVIDRMDANSTGLLLFTNDSKLIKKLINPKHPIKKIYHIELNKKLEFEDFQKIDEGIILNNSKVFVDDIKYIEGKPKREIGLQIHSGRNRIIYKIFEHLGYEVHKIDCVTIAGFSKKGLTRGQWRHLTPQEIINLKML